MATMEGTGVAGAGHAPTALVVEDEYLIRLDVVQSLRKLGWHVAEASSADEALRLIGRGLNFDLVLSDINMPGTADGLDLARAVRQLLPTAVMVLMSGRLLAGDASPELYDAFLSKPVLDFALALKPAIRGYEGLTVPIHILLWPRALKGEASISVYCHFLTFVKADAPRIAYQARPARAPGGTANYPHGNMCRCCLVGLFEIRG